MASTKNSKKDKNAGFVRGHGYISTTTGNFFNFLGVSSNGLFHFYRRFNHSWVRLTSREVDLIFDSEKGQVDKDFGGAGEDKLNLDKYILGGKV